MLSQVSHEIRNPVTLINSFMQLLEGRHPELIQDNYWQKIMENMDFLKSLLNELSAFNNSEKLNLQNSNIYNTFCEVIESVTPALNERHITIDLQKLSPIPVIKADGIKLRQLFLNLIRNASDAIETEGHIYCAIQSDGESIIFTVFLLNIRTTCLSRLSRINRKVPVSVCLSAGASSALTKALFPSNQNPVKVPHSK